MNQEFEVAFITDMFAKIVGPLAFLLFTLSAVCAESADAPSFDTLTLRLKNDDPLIRRSAVEELGRKGDSRSVKTLVNVLDDIDEDWHIRIRIINLLREIGNPFAADAIIRALQADPFPCPAIKWNAATALGRFGRYSRVVDALIYALDDDTLYVREAAILSLGESGNPRSVPFIVNEALLHSRSFAISYSAAKALGRIGDEAAIPFLERMHNDEKDPQLKSEAAFALKMISEKNRTTRR